MLTIPLLAASEASEHFVDFETPGWVWVAFVAFISVLLLFDVLVLHRNAHVITFKEAAIESAVWIALGLSFTFVILGWHGGQAAGEYVAGYLVEKSLSVDNVFVWAVILTFFRVPAAYRFRVLFWGIFGALVLRAIFIFAGVALIEQFEWILYVFGAFLIYTGVKIARHDEAEVHPENNLALKIVRRFVPTTDEYDGQKLFTRVNLKRVATPLFTVLVMIEATDVVFAVDSIPAILAITQNEFIVFSSNAFAILGLRSLYFVLADMAGRFRYLNTGLGFIMGFVGIKMLLVGEPVEYHFPIAVSLGIIALILFIAIWASLRADKRDHEDIEEYVEDHVAAERSEEESH
jgi:tellurite resistance protein TerC